MTEPGITSAPGPWCGTMKYYYLLDYDAKAEKIKHYRVDKILRLSISEETREGKRFSEKSICPGIPRDSLACLAGKKWMSHCSEKTAWPLPLSTGLEKTFTCR